MQNREMNTQPTDFRHKNWQLLVSLVVLVIGCALSSQAVQAQGMPGPKDLIMKGDAKCTTCHDESDEPEPTIAKMHAGVLTIGRTKHGTQADSRTPTCVSCHGESDRHIKSPPKGEKRVLPDRVFGKGATSAQGQNSSCLSCHQGGQNIGWHAGAHGSKDVTCVSCHSVHTPHDKVRDKRDQAQVCYTCHKEQRAQANKPYHHPVGGAGGMSCSSCHNVHNSTPKHLVRNTTNETCYTCHMEKRGPFVHNHQPVSEDCGICHNPHGTTAPALLSIRQPLLCQTCHATSATHGRQFIQQGASALGNSPGTPGGGSMARGCLNCHTNIHGSNSRDGSASGRFLR